MKIPGQSTKDDRGQPPKAIVLLSGGLDSATTLAIARERGFETYALTVRYGQRHANEIEAAKAVGAALGVAEHLEISVDLRAIGGSALTADIPVPDAREAGARDEVPVTYVPARNTVLLSLATAWAEVVGAEDIFIGVHQADGPVYPDCRAEFIEAFQNLADVATAAGVEGRSHVRVHAPLLDLAKSEIIARGLELGLDYALTTSCYDPSPDGWACGRCAACSLRRQGFAEVGLDDPIRYAGGM